MADESDDNDVVVVENPQSASVAAPVPLTPVAPLHALLPRLEGWSPPHPADLLAFRSTSDDDSDLEIIAHNLPTHQPVTIKAEPVPAKVSDTGTDKKALKKHVKTETPLPSIPRTSRKSASKKRDEGDDSDIENSLPTTCKTKRVRRNNSFDMENFLLEERKHCGEFETNLLRHVCQSTAEFRKVAEETQVFHTEFLGILRNVFPAPN
jgi:hypothetical protein